MIEQVAQLLLHVSPGAGGEGEKNTVDKVILFLFLEKSFFPSIFIIL